MKKSQPQFTRYLAVSPSTRGFGFAVMEGGETLVDWGVHNVKRSKNTKCVKQVDKLIGRYHPTVLVLRDQETRTSHRAPRIVTLNRSLVALGQGRKLKTRLLSLEQLNRAFFHRDKATKQERAEFVAKCFPEELGALLPPKRRLWENEHPRMDLFDAVALAWSAGREATSRS